MNPAVALKESVKGMLGQRSDMGVGQASERPTVLIAAMDPAVRNGLGALLHTFPLDTIWLESVEAAKNLLAKGKIAACLCGFWLKDGTYRELVRHIRRERMKIPVVIVSAPACPEEYRDYLAAMNIGALEYICHPYQKSDLERILGLTMEPQTRPMTQQPAAVISPEFARG